MAHPFIIHEFIPLDSFINWLHRSKQFFKWFCLKFSQKGIFSRRFWRIASYGCISNRTPSQLSLYSLLCYSNSELVWVWSSIIWNNIRWLGVLFEDVPWPVISIRKGYKRDNTLDIDQSSVNKVRTPLRNNCRANILSPKAQFTPSKKPIDISLTDNGEMKGLPND